MDRLQSSENLPHLVQVYQPTVSIHSSIPNQDTVNDSINLNILHSQTVMSYQQVYLQTIQAPVQNECQQITSHVILPQPLCQTLGSTVPHQFCNRINEVLKQNQCILTKLDNNDLVEEENGSQSEIQTNIKKSTGKVRQKRRLAEPSQWQNNIRKERCQRGKAYISRRGKLVPEKQIQNKKDCLNSCRYKCMENINDDDRKLLFKSFYSISTNEKKFFILNTTERHLIKARDKPCGGKRNYIFKYFFIVRGTKYVVCKNFYLGTLAISQKPIYNVHLYKSDVNLPKQDGRGLSSCHPLPEAAKDRIRKHIMSLETVDSKPVKQFSRKRQYLYPNLTVKQVYIMYVNECVKICETPLKESMYRKIFKNEFNLCFIKKEKVCGKCKGPVTDSGK